MLESPIHDHALVLASTLRPAAGHRPQHDEHDGRRSVHHDSPAHDRAWRAAGDARVARGARSIVVPDGMVWSELGSAMPGSGGSYVYLREGYGREKWGRLTAFLFIWQFILSGPLEIASGYIGFSQYLGYLWPSLSTLQFALIAAAGRGAEPGPAVPAHRLARAAHGDALGGQPPDHGCGHRHRCLPLRSAVWRSTSRRAPSTSRWAS